ETEEMAREMRRALEEWLTRPAVPFIPAPALYRPLASERACAPAPRARVVAAACQTPTARPGAPVPSELRADREPVQPVGRSRPAWRLLLPAFWLAFVGGIALVFVAAGWSPAAAVDLLALAALEAGRRAVAGDPLGLGVGL